MVLSKCAVSGSKTSWFIKERGAIGLLISLLEVKSRFEGITILSNTI